MTDTEIQTTILRELRELRGSFEDFSTAFGRRLDSLESTLSSLVAPVPASRPRPRPVLVKT
jgi:hypothetical protein